MKNTETLDPARLAGLMRRVVDKDVEAFKLLYAACGSKLYAVTLKIVRDPVASEDALQETFLKVWRKADQFNCELGSPLAWMATIARNTALDYIRSVRSAEFVDSSEIENLPAQIEPQSDAGLRRLVDQLPPDQARAIVLMYTYGFSHSELALNMNVPLGTAKSWVRRGTETLRQIITSSSLDV
jgi:RNA polymerase sigma-70 factor, ECF subfamily